MRPTRRLWAILSLVPVLALSAVVLSRPSVLFGAAMVGTWALVRQARFLATARRTARELAVHREPERWTLRTGESTSITIAGTLERPVPLAISFSPGLPTAATTDDEIEPDLTLEPGETQVTATATVDWPVAGRHQFRPVTVRVTDGWFRTSFPTGSSPAVTVQPRTPQNVHVGAGGDQAVSPYGEHTSGQIGSGIEPAELREYLPGDTMDQIDWKATARQGTTYVRDTQSETDRQTMLVVDARSTLAAGTPGETKLDYAREVALTTVDAARELADPLGLVIVDDDGIRSQFDPTASTAGYATIRRRVFDLETDDSSPTSRSGSGSLAHRTPVLLGDASRGQGFPLAGDDPFSATLRPYLEFQTSGDTRVQTNSLAQAVGTTITNRDRRVFAVVVTDDEHRTDLLETVRHLRSRNNDVLVLLTPTVLYERGGLGDLERAYERYVEFEDFRRTLSRIDRVHALEVGPGDRLDSVLSVGRERGVRQ
ncbi:DUF58 domain-containing protein [Halobacteria archaeon AArc-m2/3/4]|uniref:DUF58 domain-containing protein n=1 Tax=Natronoglomus mannanivorans TaxID=2979990 RepID=A0ABT2QJ54_9EURY|nr:DUF58 domain-containing protein [Halobacteria archaeon AArc-m2/3/4]